MHFRQPKKYFIDSLSFYFDHFNIPINFDFNVPNDVANDIVIDVARSTLPANRCRAGTGNENFVHWPYLESNNSRLNFSFFGSPAKHSGT